MANVKEVLLLDESYKEASGEHIKTVLANSFVFGNHEFSSAEMNKINTEYLSALKQ